MMAFFQLVFFTLILHGVNCQGIGALRLVRNNVYSSTQAYTSGIVEIYYYGTGWGNICNDFNVGYTEANVICNQLGFNGASSYGNAGSVLM
jgi:hypothetical protein